jgi:hypothetical protein
MTLFTLFIVGLLFPFVLIFGGFAVLLVFPLYIGGRALYPYFMKIEAKHRRGMLIGAMWGLSFWFWYALVKA